MDSVARSERSSEAKQRQWVQHVLGRLHRRRRSIGSLATAHSDLKASVGLNLDARTAGSIPKTTPTMQDTANATTIEAVETGMRKLGSKNRTLNGIASPITIPASPPARLIRIASIRNCV